MVQRLSLPIGVAAVQLGAAVVVLGRPSLGEAADFFLSRAPTMASALAASRLTIWVVVLAACAAAVAAAVGTTVTGLRQRRRRRVWGGLVMLAGLLILGLGVGHQVQPGQVSL